VGAVEDCHVADSVDQSAGCTLGQVGEEGVAGFAIAATGGFHLDQLVIVQGPGGFCCDRVGEAGVTEADDRLELVGKATQVAALLFGELRRGWRRNGGRGRPLGCSFLPWLTGSAPCTDTLRSVQAASSGSLCGGSGRPGAAGGDAFLVHKRHCKRNFMVQRLLNPGPKP
jgi:hypothetical protein